MIRPDWRDEATWAAAEEVSMSLKVFARGGDGFDRTTRVVARALLAAEQRGAEREREAIASHIERDGGNAILANAIRGRKA